MGEPNTPQDESCPADQQHAIHEAEKRTDTQRQCDRIDRSIQPLHDLRMQPSQSVEKAQSGRRDQSGSPGCIRDTPILFIDGYRRNDESRIGSTDSLSRHQTEGNAPDQSNQILRQGIGQRERPSRTESRIRAELLDQIVTGDSQLDAILCEPTREDSDTRQP
ncbi:hypothetical protein HRbin27_01535 [bacterium HR27]|nr:hypothetical protein HRbin27_01535 [bacterium HR27]